jgi:hypothetical protein
MYFVFVLIFFFNLCTWPAGKVKELKKMVDKGYKTLVCVLILTLYKFRRAITENVRAKLK